MSKTQIVKAEPVTPAPVLPVLPVAELQSYVAAIRQVVDSVFEPGRHFVTIPGNDKPFLAKPGAEIACLALRLIARFEVEDLSTSEHVRYRIRCDLLSDDGIVRGSGHGEASTAEEKWAWRWASEAEWRAAPENRRRKKWKRSGSPGYQVRQDPLSQANTILKMAEKRAHVCAAIRTCALSDRFSQDEDYQQDAPPTPPAARRPPPRQQTPDPPNPLSGRIDEIQSGVAKNGARWWRVTLGSHVLGTFSTTHGSELEAAHQDGYEVTLNWESRSGSRAITQIATSIPVADDEQEATDAE